MLTLIATSGQNLAHSLQADGPAQALFNLGPLEITMILAVILLLFGGRKLPELAKGLGEGLKEFKNASKEVAKDDDANEPAAKAS